MLFAFVVLAASWSSEARSQTSGAHLVNTLNGNWLLLGTGHIWTRIAGFWRLSGCQDVNSTHLGAAVMLDWFTGCSTFTRRVQTFYWCAEVPFIIYRRYTPAFRFLCLSLVYRPRTCLCIPSSRLHLWLCSRWCWLYLRGWWGRGGHPFISVLVWWSC